MVRKSLTNRKYTCSEKEQVIELYKMGHSYLSIGKQLNICNVLISQWVSRYKQGGLSSLLTSQRLSYPSEIRQEVIVDVIKNSLSLKQASLKYNVSRYSVFSWVKKFKEQGLESLSNPLPILKSELMGRNKKREPETDLERLQLEVLYLRAENDLLKKMKALIQEREKELHARKPKASKN